MRKLLLFLLVTLLAVVFLGNLSTLRNLGNLSQEQVAGPKPKSPILRVGLISDSHNENDLLAKALAQAKGMGVNFVIGLGDYTNTGTISELESAKEVFDESRLNYFVTAGDHDLWDSRDKGKEALANFREIFGRPSQIIDRENISFVILDNSDIYRGIKSDDLDLLKSSLGSTSANSADSESQKSKAKSRKLSFVFAQKTPFHPESKHVMGSENSRVASQAKDLMDLLEAKKVDGFFCGDLHFFAQFKSPNDIVKMTTIGAVASQRNFQGPRLAILTVFDDYSWQVEDVEIR